MDLKFGAVLSSFLLLAALTGAAAASPADPEYRNSIGMGFRLLAAGTFMMGSPEEEPGRDTDETRHQVTLSRAFYMQTTEVTQGQWQAVMGSNPSMFVECGADCPVERVSWHEVQEFIARLNQQTGQSYRLPTEAEFEYAARAGSSQAFANGPITQTACDLDPVLDAMAWYCYNADERPHPVAGKQANAWGLYDMHGNVWEWCADSRTDGDYPAAPVTDPLSPNAGEDRVIRGGSWSNDAWFARAANRDWTRPEYRNDYVGFRLVLDPAR
ncbi:MAG: formylglycine-generating enzyme family protein [Desulfobulbaceae bacterium]|nr:formylglycine-generating enzyme family protein [Desulfobulbaceae bacterium]